jgi:hypothetical protein
VKIARATNSGGERRLEWVREMQECLAQLWREELDSDAATVVNCVGAARSLATSREGNRREGWCVWERCKGGGQLW